MDVFNYLQDEEDWMRVERVFEMATSRGCYLGEINLVCKSALTGHAYLIKKKKQGRIKMAVFG